MRKSQKSIAALPIIALVFFLITIFMFEFLPYFGSMSFVEMIKNIGESVKEYFATFTDFKGFFECLKNFSEDMFTVIGYILSYVLVILSVVLLVISFVRIRKFSVGLVCFLACAFLAFGAMCYAVLLPSYIVIVVAALAEGVAFKAVVTLLIPTVSTLLFFIFDIVTLIACHRRAKLALYGTYDEECDECEECECECSTEEPAEVAPLEEAPVIVEAPVEEEIPAEEEAPAEEPAPVEPAPAPVEPAPAPVEEKPTVTADPVAFAELIRNIVREEMNSKKPTNNTPVIIQYFGDVHKTQQTLSTQDIIDEVSKRVTEALIQRQPVVVQPAPVEEKPVVVEAPVEPAPAPAPVEAPAKVVVERIPFTTRIVKAEKEMKDNFNELKNEILSYGVKSRVSNTGDTFRLHRKTFVKITVAGKSLKLYFALDPENYKDSTIPVGDAGDKAIYEETPLVFKVKSALSVKRAKQLIKDCMEYDGLTQGEVLKTNWVREIAKGNTGN